MKTKSEARREAILQAAAASFQEHGFDGASMEDIAARTPCSKVTIYAYFASKETLFYEAIVQALDGQFHVLYEILEDSEADVVQVLTTFGEQFITLVLTEEVRALRRLVMTAQGAGAADLQRKCFDAGPQVAIAVCANYFRRVQERGVLLVQDTRLACMQLRALLEAEWLDSLFYNQTCRPSKKRIRQSAERAVSAFLAIQRERRM
jgi:AcrR family transcriptional regulator